MKNNKLSLLRDQNSISSQMPSRLLTNTTHLKSLHMFTNRINYLKEEVNRLNFMMTEIHNIVKTRFQ